jgi:hypothetical protein
MTARASEEADAHTLPGRPAAHVRTEGIDPADGLMAGDPRPVDWEHAINSA